MVCNQLSRSYWTILVWGCKWECNACEPGKLSGRGEAVLSRSSASAFSHTCTMVSAIWSHAPYSNSHSCTSDREVWGQRHLKTPHAWSPHSPDFNAPDFFLWGYAKDNVYKNNPTTIPDLKHEIEVFMRGINVEMFQQLSKTLLYGCENA